MTTIGAPAPKFLINWTHPLLWLFALMFMALSPTTVYAGGDCELNTELSALAARRNTTLRGPLSVGEIDQKYPSSDQWLKIKTWLKPGDQLFHVLAKEGVFRSAYYIAVRNGCVRRTLLEFIS